MTEKSDLWDIEAEAIVTFTRVYFNEEVTKKEAIERFKNGNFSIYEELEQQAILKVRDAEAY